MSAVLGVFGPADARPPAALAGPMLARMARRGAGVVDVHRAPGALLAVARHGWETAPHLGGPARVAADGAVRVAADAALYHRGDLLRALAARGVRPAGESAAELILAAYRAWGVSCPRWLEGDFAFVLWDGAARRALCARDFAGKRPLVYAALGDTLVAASTAGGVLAHPAVPAELDPVSIAETAAGLWAGSDATAFRAVRTLLAGHTLVWCDGRVRIDRHWTPPRLGSAAGPPFQQAAEELRERLVSAAAERLPSAGPAAVWMSGGWDSTAVFATAQVAAQREGRIKPTAVSISYPEGDPGREDELIESVGSHWNSDVHWLNIAEIPFLDREQDSAAGRDEPYKHLYENWNAALAAGSRATGSRVALDGNGGDQLFQSSDVFLADLFRQGKWLTLAREWPTRKRGGYREMFSTVIQPNLGPLLLGTARVARGGRRLRHYLERELPTWLDAGFVVRQRLEERDQAYMTRPVSASRAEREIDWYFTCLFVSRAFARLSTLALASGVELRSPLSDRRVIELALSRPWWERSSGTETKRLLRTAMRGLLPEQVLAPRPFRTGVTSGYSHGAMTKVFPSLLAAVRGAPLILEELGIVNARKFYEAASGYAERGGSSYTRVNLFYTLQTELWLRAKRGTSPSTDVDLHAPAALAG